MSERITNLSIDYKIPDIGKNKYAHVKLYTFYIIWCLYMCCIFVLAIWELLNKSHYFPGCQGICLIQSITNKQEN